MTSAAFGGKDPLAVEIEAKKRKGVLTGLAPECEEAEDRWCISEAISRLLPTPDLFLSSEKIGQEAERLDLAIQRRP